jgi:tripartite ATP-independent transporter DctM subunit
MNPTIISILGFVALFLLFAAGMNIGFAMALIGFIGCAFMISLEASLNILARDFWEFFSSYSLTVIPMFVFMGSIAFYSGISKKLYSAAYTFLGNLPGGLAMATIGGCAVFGAICGSTTAGAAAMGKVVLPEMKRYNYNSSLATATVAAGGTLSILIPPSTAFIIYGILTEQSIGKLFIAGIMPGILLSLLFIITIYIICQRNPEFAPSGVRVGWKGRIASLSGIVDMLILFALVMGGLFFGIFSPNEAGGVGAGGALLLALARRRLTWEGLISSLSDTARITAMIFVILTGAIVFGRFIAVTRMPFELVNWVGSLPFDRYFIMSCIIFGYLIGGCVMDSLALVVLTIPILFPIVLRLNFDPIWFGVIMTLMGEAGVITPPVGINVYVIRGVVPDVPLETIFRGVWPFVGAIIVCTIILIIFPQIATYLPNLMMR